MKKYFFLLGLFVLVAILFSSYISSQIDYKINSDSLALKLKKKELLSQMYSSARYRSVLLLKMYREKDAFILDDLNQDFSLQARIFLKARQELFTYPLNDAEKSILEKQNQGTIINAPLQNQVAELLIEQRIKEAEPILLDKAIPGQNIILDRINQVIAFYDKDFQLKLFELELEEEAVRDKFMFFSILVILGFGSFFIIFIIKKEKQYFQQQMKEQKQTAKKLSYQASHDSLTGLINRLEFENRLQDLLKQSVDHENHAVLYLDLDQFKVVNDTCGHHAGDDLLRKIPVLIERNLRNSDLLARIGGDEFAIILMACDIEKVKKIAQKIINSIEEFQFTWEGKIFKIGVSIGIVEITDDLNSLHDVLKNADSACYAAKDAGRNQFVIYRPDERSFKLRSEEMDWLSRINNALEQDHFKLYAQIINPIQADLDERSSYEILLRMEINNEIVLPGAFLSAAERYGQMVDVDKWVIENTFNLLKNNSKFLDAIDHISINLSGVSLNNQSFLMFLTDNVNKSGFSNKICFEITETAAMNNLDNVQKIMVSLRAMGVRFSLDDFGSGSSSFAYLKNLNVDYLKIDGFFVKSIVTDSIDLAMVKSIHDIGSVMGIKTIAEFVENEDILKKVKSIGIDYAQGYFLSTPVPFTDIIRH